jgi:hypothetical protein
VIEFQPIGVITIFFQSVVFCMPTIRSAPNEIDIARLVTISHATCLNLWQAHASIFGFEE